MAGGRGRQEEEEGEKREQEEECSRRKRRSRAVSKDPDDRFYVLTGKRDEFRCIFSTFVACSSSCSSHKTPAEVSARQKQLYSFWRKKEKV